MKKYNLFALLLSLSAIILATSCGSKSPEEILQELNYREACEGKDFEKAYQMVDKIKVLANDAHEEMYNHRGSKEWSVYLQRGDFYEEKAKEAERYVVLHEAMFVLESQNTDGLRRIVGIAKEHNVEDWLYSELLDVAKKIGDTDLENRIETMIQPDNSNNMEEKVVSEDVDETTPKMSDAKKRSKR